MIERVVENWLDSTNERGYENAFCQVLTAEGHTIIRRPAHGPTEHGKDVVTRDRKGHLHAYQLKTGNLDKATWRQIRGEVEELINVPLQEPGISPRARFTPHLVTNGEVKEPVKDEVRARSQGAHEQGYRRLEFINRDELLHRFVQLHGTFFPATPGDFERFLRLYLADKRGFLAKDEFSEFLLSSLPSPAEVKKTRVRRAIAATAILANYILSGYLKAGNHLGLAEGWMLVFGHALRVVEATHPRQDDWLPVVELCIDGWETATNALVQEAMISPNWIEGDISVDNFVFGHRKTLLIGYLAAFALYRRLAGRPLHNEDDILVRISAELQALQLWGESAMPYFIAVMLFLWKRGREGEAVNLCADLIKVITKLNGSEDERGLPDPYLDGHDVLHRELSAKRVLDVMRFVLQRDRDRNSLASDEFYRSLASLVHNSTGRPAWDVWYTFARRSFGIRCLVEFLVRRERKSALKSLWYDVTRVDYSEFTPANASDFYLWRAKKGSLVTRRFRRPETWENLVSAANGKSQARTILFRRFPELLMPFALVYPHRLTPDLVRIWENSLSKYA